MDEKKTMSEQEKQFTRIVYNSAQCPMHSILNIFSYAKYFSVAVVFFLSNVDISESWTTKQKTIDN